MSKLRDTTLLFLVKKSEGQIAEVCLAMKKRGFGVGRWNGVGGKVDADESVVDAAHRETQEEIGVQVIDMAKAAELSFYFPHNPAWDQLVHVYLAETWKGEPKESEEMRPHWYSAGELPFADMWPDDPDWLPHVLAGKMIRGRFSFGEGDRVLEREVQIVESLA
jgi:8-oxo-dGTP pyrophosphatase MutT (NUDIX family)